MGETSPPLVDLGDRAHRSLQQSKMKTSSQLFYLQIDIWDREILVQAVRNGFIN